MYIYIIISKHSVYIEDCNIWRDGLFIVFDRIKLIPKLRVLDISNAANLDDI